MTDKAKLIGIVALAIIAALADSALAVMSLIYDGACAVGIGLLAWSLIRPKA